LPRCPSCGGRTGNHLYWTRWSRGTLQAISTS
jgi:hypothetical protein